MRSRSSSTVASTCRPPFPHAADGSQVDVRLAFTTHRRANGRSIGAHEDLAFLRLQIRRSVVLHEHVALAVTDNGVIQASVAHLAFAEAFADLEHVALRRWTER